jgi:predicted SnoaL-like aldol condensation-catalyzing enzyme
MPPRTAGITESQSPEYAARTARNRALLLDFVRLYYDEMKVREAFERYVHPDYMQHNPAVTDGREAAIAHLEGPARTADGQHGRPPHPGGWRLWIRPSDCRQGPEDPGHALMNIFRFADGLIVEHWDVAQPVPATTASGRGMG